MSSSSSHDSSRENSNNMAVPQPTNLNTDDESRTKRRPSAMSRRLSFSTTRPWSSYAQNYSSCLSGLRRNSSGNLHKRNNSLPESSKLEYDGKSGLSRSLDTQQLRSLKTATEVEKPVYKLSAMHARPFHQRRWSSPVLFSVARPPATPLPQAVKHEDTPDKGVQDSSDEKYNQVVATGDIKPSHVTQNTSVPTSNKEKEYYKETTSTYDKGQDTQMPKKSEANDNDEKQLEQPNIITKPETNVCTKSKEDCEVVSSQIQCESEVDKTVTVKTDVENGEKKQIAHAIIKSNTQWSCSKRFRRRHHTAEFKSFLNRHNLSTIAEQSSASFDAQVTAANDEHGVRKLYTRKSKSMDDLTMLKKENKNVSVQRLRSNPLSVTVKSIKIPDKQKERSGSAVYQTGKDVMKQNQCVVNIQTFNYKERSDEEKPQLRHVVCRDQTKSNAQTIMSRDGVISRPQHVVFTQAKPKWASITISQV